MAKEKFTIGLLFLTTFFLSSCIREEAPNAECDIIAVSEKWLQDNSSFLSGKPVVKNSEVWIYVKEGTDIEFLKGLEPVFELTPGAHIIKGRTEENGEESGYYLTRAPIPNFAELVRDLGARVYPVGRLDMDSDGLLLLTDDGELTNRLTHPRHEIPKHYLVTVKGVVSPAQLQRLNQSFLLDGYQTQPARVKKASSDGKNDQLLFTLYEGRNRQIRRMCEETDLAITRLTRIAIGNIGLGDLPIGRYRHLSEQEVSYLKGKQKL